MAIIHNICILTTYYDILGVDPKVEPEILRKAYRKLARSYHPDVNDHPGSHEQMAKINAAFETLSDPVRRLEYDARLNGGRIEDPQVNSRNSYGNLTFNVQLMQRLQEHKTPIYAVSFIPGTEELLASSFDNEIFMWDTQTETSSGRIKLEGGAVSTIESITKDHFFAAGCSENTVSTWNVVDSAIHAGRMNAHEWVCSVKASKDAAYIAFGTVSGKLCVIDTLTGETVLSTMAHEQSVTALAWSTDGKHLASGSADATVKLWEIQTGALYQSFTNVRSTVTALALSQDGEKLAVAAVDLSIRIFSLSGEGAVRVLFGHEKPIESLAFDPKSEFLASAGRDGLVYIWSSKGEFDHLKIRASHQAINCVTFSPDGTKFVTGGLDKVLRIWKFEIESS